MLKKHEVFPDIDRAAKMRLQRVLFRSVAGEITSHPVSCLRFPRHLTSGQRTEHHLLYSPLFHSLLPRLYQRARVPNVR